jgi:hypothetical protein
LEKGRCASDECHDVNIRNTSIMDRSRGILGQQFNYSDTCINSTVIIERSCIYTANQRSQPYEKTTNCPAGTQCREGICASAILDTSHDSDEMNPQEKGSIYGTLNYQEYNYTDTCYSAEHVQEYYCWGLNVTLPRMMTVACQENETCKEGRCISGNNTLRECNMTGNVYPCDQMTLQKVVNSITGRIDERLNLGDVIMSIISWSDP